MGKNNVILEEKIFLFFRRLIGFSPHQHTKAFIRENLNESFDNFLRMSSTSNNTSTSLSIFIYEDVLAKIFNQMKFLDAFPILGLLYSERIFFGLANDQIDDALGGNINQPELLFRFESCSSTEYPNILFVISNGRSNRIESNIFQCFLRFFFQVLFDDRNSIRMTLWKESPIVFVKPEKIKQIRH